MPGRRIIDDVADEGGAAAESEPRQQHERPPRLHRGFHRRQFTRRMGRVKHTCTLMGWGNGGSRCAVMQWATGRGAPYAATRAVRRRWSATASGRRGGALQAEW
ncbi:hypothetical protein GCM10023353_39620 [Tomitella cavernea]|uniref:Uncharacterized protein n=1 Tax=Tomitella cavernea TaxID=1387982 RepID=A0ABP9D3M4_9ACTN